MCETLENRIKAGCRFTISILIFLFLWAGMGSVFVHADSLSQGKIEELMRKFPDGKYWDHLCEDPNTTRSESYQNSVTDHKCSHKEQTGYYDCNHFDGAGQCYGFARKMAYEYYKVYFSRQPKSYDLSKLKAGDIVRYHPGSADHSIWVTAVNGNDVTYAECNYSGPCMISWNKTTTLDIIRRSFLYIEQAPDIQIMLDSSEAGLYEGEALTLHASVASGGSAADEAVYWRTSDSSVASVDPSGTVTGFKPGTAVVTAYLAGDRATADCIVTVKESVLSLERSSLSLYIGSEVTLAVRVEGKSKTAVWSSSRKAVATVKDGKVKGKKAGTAVITVKANGKSAKCKVTVKEPSIKLNKKSATIYTGGDTTVKLKAAVKGPDTRVKWKSDKPSVATVNSSGKVTAKKKGTAVITAEANGKTAKCTVKVEKPSIKLNKKDATIYTSGNNTVKLKAVQKPLSLGVKWKSSNPSVASVSSDGKVTGKKKGEAVITAQIDGASAKCKVIVKTASIKLDKNKVTLYLTRKRTVVLSAKVKGASSKVKWESSDPSVAAVSSKGKVTAKKVGVTDITAKANGKSAKCRIIVKSNTAVISDGHIYDVFNLSYDWETAKAYCERLGGHLATITSQKEQNIIASLITNQNRNSYWLGAERDGTGYFRFWITGEAITYSNFAYNQPDNHTGRENALCIYRKENPIAGGGVHVWNDLQKNGECNREAFFGLNNIGFICEWE